MFDINSVQASQAVIKETLTHRKNTSPQNVYETSQLYAAGALKVACIGLQCIGFNIGLYRTILEAADRCAGRVGGSSVAQGGWKLSPSTSPGPEQRAPSALSGPRSNSATPTPTVGSISTTAPTANVSAGPLPLDGLPVAPLQPSMSAPVLSPTAWPVLAPSKPAPPSSVAPNQKTGAPRT